MQLKKLDLDKDTPSPSKEELVGVSKETLQCEIAALEENLEGMTPNMAAIEEYKRKEQVHQARLEELDQVTGQRDEARRSYEAMRKERLDKFMGGFSTITNKLKEMYQVSWWPQSEFASSVTAPSPLSPPACPDDHPGRRC